MPTYEYRCRACGHGFDIVQSFKDESLTICPACGGELRKVFSAPSISFKGSGFYATDSRKGAKKKESSETGGKTQKKEEGSDAGSKSTETSGSGGSKSSGDGGSSSGSGSSKDSGSGSGSSEDSGSGTAKSTTKKEGS